MLDQNTYKNGGKMSRAYIGFRVEVTCRVIKNAEEIIDTYNKSGKCKIFDMHHNGKICIEKTKDMITAKGEDCKKLAKTSGIVNFGIMAPIEKKKISRVVQIINVLGNGKLIKERVKTFADGESTLNQLPELSALNYALGKLEDYAPGLILNGWYYAPEMKVDM